MAPNPPVRQTHFSDVTSHAVGIQAARIRVTAAAASQAVVLAAGEDLVGYRVVSLDRVA